MHFMDDVNYALLWVLLNLKNNMDRLMHCKAVPVGQRGFYGVRGKLVGPGGMHQIAGAGVHVCCLCCVECDVTRGRVTA